MLISLEEWAAKAFSHPPSIGTLRAWARTGQIHPNPMKVARRYCVEENARYVPLADTGVAAQDPIIDRILSHGSKAA